MSNKRKNNNNDNTVNANTDITKAWSFFKFYFDATACLNTIWFILEGIDRYINNGFADVDQSYKKLWDERYQNFWFIKFYCMPVYPNNTSNINLYINRSREYKEVINHVKKGLVRLYDENQLGEPIHELIGFAIERINITSEALTKIPKLMKLYPQFWNEEKNPDEGILLHG